MTHYRRPLYPASKYTFRLLWSESDRRFVGVCSEFPLLRYSATTENDALAGIENRVGDELASLVRNRQDTPEPLIVRRYGR